MPTPAWLAPSYQYQPLPPSLFAALEVVNLPAGLASLAQAYGVDTLLSARHSRSTAGAEHLST